MGERIWPPTLQPWMTSLPERLFWLETTHLKPTCWWMNCRRLQIRCVRVTTRPPHAYVTLLWITTGAAVGGVQVMVGDRPLDISSHTVATYVRLSNALHRSLTFRPFKAGELAYVEAEFQEHPETGETALEPASGSKGHEMCIVRTRPITLPEIRKRLLKAGIKCEPCEGGLITASGLAIRKGFLGNHADLYTVILEGPICDEFFTIRQALAALYIAI